MCLSFQICTKGIIVVNKTLGSGDMFIVLNSVMASQVIRISKLVKFYFFMHVLYVNIRCFKKQQSTVWLCTCHASKCMFKNKSHLLLQISCLRQNIWSVSPVSTNNMKVHLSGEDRRQVSHVGAELIKSLSLPCCTRWNATPQISLCAWWWGCILPCPYLFSTGLGN